MLTDPIADTLTRIRNAARAGCETVQTPYSRVNKSVLNVLQEKGFVKKVDVIKKDRFQEIVIKLDPDKKDIHLKRISTPGRRVYIGAGEIRPVLNGFGVFVISTSKGMMASPEARKMRLGGEVICEVW